MVKTMLDNFSVSEILKIIIPGIIGFWTSHYLSKHSRHMKTLEVRFNNVYLPMYNLVEPYLYKDNNHSELLVVMKLIYSISQENRHLISEGLKANIPILIHQIENKYAYESLFDIVGFAIEKEYFKLKTALGYPRRIRISDLIRNASLRRFKTRLKYSDLIFGEIFFVIAIIVVFGITGQFAFNLLIKFFNLIDSLL